MFTPVVFATVLVLVLVLAVFSNAMSCDTARYPYAATPGLSFPIVQPALLQTYTKLPGTLKIQGSIKIINGCTFEMTLTGAEQAVQAAELVWYGRLPSDTAGKTLTDQTFYVTGTGSSQSYDTLWSLTNVAGRAMSFYDFTEMELYSVYENNQYATVTLSGGNMTQYAIGEPAHYTVATAPAGVPLAPLATFLPGVSGTAPTLATVPTELIAPISPTSAAAGGASPAGSATSATSPASTKASSAFSNQASTLAAFFVALCVTLLF